VNDANRLLAAAVEVQEFCERRHWRFCFTPGALVVLKAFADRVLDWHDIKGVIVKSGKRIDWDDVRRDLAALLELKGDAQPMAKLEAMLAARK